MEYGAKIIVDKVKEYVKNNYIIFGNLYVPKGGVYLRNLPKLQEDLNKLIGIIIKYRYNKNLSKGLSNLSGSTYENIQNIFGRHYERITAEGVTDAIIYLKQMMDVCLETTDYQPGKFILFEGCDAAGKDFIINRVEFNTYGPYIETREPGGPEISEVIRRLLLDKINLHTMSYNAEVLLYAASRAQHVDEVIIPALQAGTNVFCHRYYHTSAIYQQLRGIAVEDIVNVNKLAIRNTNPDLTVVINAKPETIKNRLANKNKDRLELEDHSFYETVLANYQDLENNEVVKQLDSDIKVLLVNSEDGVEINVEKIKTRLKETLGGK